MGEIARLVHQRPVIEAGKNSWWRCPTGRFNDRVRRRTTPLGCGCCSMAGAMSSKYWINPARLQGCLHPATKSLRCHCVKGQVEWQKQLFDSSPTGSCNVQVPLKCSSGADLQVREKGQYQHRLNPPAAGGFYPVRDKNIYFRKGDLYFG